MSLLKAHIQLACSLGIYLMTETVCLRCQLKPTIMQRLLSFFPPILKGKHGCNTCAGLCIFIAGMHLSSLFRVPWAPSCRSQGVSCVGRPGSVRDNQQTFLLAQNGLPSMASLPFLSTKPTVELGFPNLALAPMIFNENGSH